MMISLVETWAFMLESYCFAHKNLKIKYSLLAEVDS